MLFVDREILKISKAICGNIASLNDPSEQWLLKMNISKYLRDFVEHVAIKIHANGEDVAVDYENIKKAVFYLKQESDYKFLTDFHGQLQSSVSHYTLDEDASERVFMGYYELEIIDRDKFKIIEIVSS